MAKSSEGLVSPTSEGSSSSNLYSVSEKDDGRTFQGSAESEGVVDELELPSEDETRSSSDREIASLSDNRKPLPCNDGSNDPLTDATAFITASDESTRDHNDRTLGSQHSSPTNLKRKHSYDAPEQHNEESSSGGTFHASGINDPLRITDYQNRLQQSGAGPSPGSSGWNNKRARLSEFSDSVVGDSGAAAREDHRSRIPFGRCNLLPEIWQHVFTFLSPRSLGRMLRVNRAFNAYLSESVRDGKDVASQPSGRLQQLETEVIWSASRKRFCPSMPRPLHDFSELAMWKLVLGNKCQFCERLEGPSSDGKQTTIWEAGPGETGVRIIWPFGIRSCGPCLRDNCEKVSAMALPSFVLPALPFALVTPSLHLIPSISLQNSTTPPTLQMTKLYYKPHIESIKNQLNEVKSLGPATAEEWMKGLEGNGKEKISDAARWERWEAKGGLKDILSTQTNACLTESSQLHNTTASLKTVEMTDLNLSARPSPTSTGPSKIDPLEINNSANRSAPLGPQPSATNSRTYELGKIWLTSRGSSPLSSGLPWQNGAAQKSQIAFQSHRSERNIHDVNEAKAARRAEIERRCMELTPPIPANLLSHMDSFKAAVQITTPLTDNAWEVLKPRLISQLDVAEQRENEQAIQTHLYQAKYEERRQQEAELKEAKEAQDREWDEIQSPIRDRLGLFADEIIRDKWAEGKAITYDSSPKFAAEVLLHVRHRFYEEIAAEDAATRAAGKEVPQDPIDGPPTRRLILENMKWVFDAKIKPLTEKFRKELFLCNGCENNFKFYGFEGVVQHYAAKHTSALSKGSIVVHWRSEWPLYSPFHPDPKAAKSAFHAQSQAPRPIQYGTYSQVPVPGMPGPIQVAQHNYPQYSPGSYAQPHFPDQYHRPGPFGPPPVAPAFQNQPPVFQGSPYQPQGNSNVAGFQGPQPQYSGQPNQNYDSFRIPYQAQPPHPYGPTYPGQAYSGSPVQVPRRTSLQSYGSPSGFREQPAGGYPNSQAFSPPNLPDGPYVAQNQAQPAGIYQVQLEEMANNARDIWFGTSGIKNLPGNVRVYVIIHHVVSNFKAKFTNEPSLAMFTDGITHHPLMKPIKNVNGLACKSCHIGGNGIGAGPHSQALASGDRKLYTLPALLFHFQTHHVERAKPPVVPQGGIATPRLDWKEDMIELPSESFISSFIDAPGIDDKKLQLIAQVFPGIFPSPLPRVGFPSNPGPVPRGESFPSPQGALLVHSSRPLKASPWQQSSNLLPPKPQPYDYTRKGRQRLDSTHADPLAMPFEQSPRATEVPGEDEYDPHRPAFVEAPGHSLGTRRRPEEEYRPQIRDPVRAFTDHDPQPYRDDTLVVRGEDRRAWNYIGSPSRRSIKMENTSMRSTSPERPPSQTRLEDLSNGFRGPRSQGSAERALERVQRGVRQTPRPFHKPAAPLERRREGSSLPHPGNIGSEDGEVRDEPAEALKQPGPLSPSEGISAAERFLNEFLPGQDAEEYKRKAAEHEREKEEKLKARWLADREAEERELKYAEYSGSRSRRDDMPTADSRERDALYAPVPPAPRSGRIIGPQSDEVSREPLEYHKDDRYGETAMSRPRPLGRSPEVIESHFPRQDAVYLGSRYDAKHHHPLQRSRSGFSRYEAQRYRTRSRSPHRGEEATLEEGSYRARSPQQYERVYQDPPSPEIISPGRVAQPPVATNAPPHYEYRYSEGLRGYEPVYGEPVEYIPVRYSSRQPRQPDAYVLSHTGTRSSVAEYVDADLHAQEQLYEHQGQLYRAESRVYQDEPAGADPRDPQLRY
ncbi:MAG: hypothetical protein M1819_005009 [Sarea resinae]|nr:MAG: hypothetical protein M1819_005009 [Sarea resinae]